MSDRFHYESIIHQVGNTLNPNPPQGYDPTLDAQQHQLMREQHDFYTQQQQSMNGQPSDGLGGLQGLKEAATGVAILLILGLFFKYIVGVG